jgi:hypothetical protein
MRTELLGLLLPCAALLLPATALFLPLPATAVPAVGNPIVYHSPGDTGARPTSPVEIPYQNGQELYLYLDYENDRVPPESTNSATMCVDEDGNETCGFDVLIKLTTDAATFGSFTPDSPAVVGHFDATNTQLRVNGIEVGGMAIPARIGTLTVDALGSNQLQISVQGHHRVGAAGQLDGIQSHVISVPEPGVSLLLIVGVVGLRGLVRLRARRRTAAG